ncbi:MAG: NTP transferase domain-containing protein [Nanoarchaeota archaeon]|nr:NTP transferase domain-containing protein [Nanoarchaeota archaeon]
MKVIIPVAGGGTRLKPHTLSTPKQMLKIAGVEMLDYVINSTMKLNPDEVIFIVGHHKEQIMNHIKENFSQIPYSFVEQKVRNGDGSAVLLGLESIQEDVDDELFVLFGDTLIDFDIIEMVKRARGRSGSVACQRVENPTQYGVVELNSENKVVGIEEKPDNPKSDLAIIGAYYFHSFKQVKTMLQKHQDEKITVKGEYRIAQVISELALSKDDELEVYEVDKWFDCGRVSVLLEANSYFLEKMSKHDVSIKHGEDCIIIPPCYISKGAKVSKSVIGPYVSIEEGCVVESSVISNSIISKRTQIENMHLHFSLISHDARIIGTPKKVNIGEKCEVEFK